jgi:cyclohexanone monooxygenase
VPAENAPLDAEFVRQFKTHYREHRSYQKRGLASGFGDLDIEPHETLPAAERAASVSDGELERICEKYWRRGGAYFITAFGDTMLDDDANRRVADFVRQEIRQIVKDSATAEALCPTSHPIGTKRICVDTGYYETYNRNNVTLVDLAQTPIQRITSIGIQTTDRHYDLDALVLATGFDAMTGALSKIDVRGVRELALRDKWRAGPRAYLGLMIAGFPNLFTITGPGSPSVLSNMIVSIEQHVDFIIECLEHMRLNGYNKVEAKSDAEDQWVDHVNEVASATLYPKAGSWYLGANVPGKPRVFMPYAAGVGAYREICEDVVEDAYRGFAFSVIAVEPNSSGSVQDAEWWNRSVSVGNTDL